LRRADSLSGAFLFIAWLFYRLYIALVFSAKKSIPAEDRTMDHDPSLIDMTGKIVAAYVRNNPTAAGDLPQLIREVYGALVRAREAPGHGMRGEGAPAVAIKKSVADDYIICLEDGKRFKSLKRHLRANHNLTPQQYREKWGLMADYPMVAPNYAATRSKLAKAIGLGHKPRQRRKRASSRR
jgi:predicted transcriptional regulator